MRALIKVGKAAGDEKEGESSKLVNEKQWTVQASREFSFEPLNAAEVREKAQKRAKITQALRLMPRRRQTESQGTVQAARSTCALIYSFC